MKCPYCDKELDIVEINPPEWVNKDDSEVEFECIAICHKCFREFTLNKRYKKTEEKDLIEL